MFWTRFTPSTSQIQVRMITTWANLLGTGIWCVNPSLTHEVQVQWHSLICHINENHAPCKINMNKMQKTAYLKSYVCAVNTLIQYISQVNNKRILVTTNHKMLMAKHEKDNSWRIPERKWIIMAHMSTRWIQYATSAIHYIFNTQGDIMLHKDGEYFYRKISKVPNLLWRWYRSLIWGEQLTKILTKEWVINSSYNLLKCKYHIENNMLHMCTLWWR